ncbi:MAG: hypothetical protein ABJB12_03160, partial [Pseudomonadota bacterium]
MITSKHATTIFLAGLIGTILTQQGCGSDTSGPSGATAGSAGAPSAGAPSAGAPSAGAPSAGAPSAGAPSAGAPSAGAPATGGGGAGGAAAGSGGSGGGSAGNAGMGGGTATFMAVKTLFGASCGVGQCHNAASKNLDYQGTHDLHGLLTMPIPSGIDHCVGTNLVKPNDASNFLVT